MKTIWLSGSNGFLGKNLLESLNKNYQCNPILRVTYPQELKGDILIHCGWISASNSNDLNNSNQIDNITESISLFHRGLRGGIKHFIFIGSSWQDSKYGNNLYQFSKNKTHDILQKLCEINNVKYNLIIPYWIYGLYDKPNRFIPSIINKCLNNQDIAMHPAQNMVDYLFCDDFISAIDLILRKGENFQDYNICSGYGYKTQDIVEKIKELTCSKSKTSHNKEYPKNFNMEWIGNNDKLKEIGWLQKINLEDGLKRTINYERLNRI